MKCSVETEDFGFGRNVTIVVTIVVTDEIVVIVDVSEDDTEVLVTVVEVVFTDRPK